MLKHIIILALGTSVCCAASSQTDPQTKIHLTKEQCARLIVNHKSSDSIDYKPNIDGEGKSLVPVETEDTNKVSVPDKFSFHVWMKVNRLIQAPPTIPGNKNFVKDVYDGSFMDAGKIEISKSGEVRYNGQKISSEGKSDLEKACRQAFPDL